MTKYVLIFSVILSLITIGVVKYDINHPEGFDTVTKLEKKKNVRDASIHVIGGHRAFMHGK